MVSYKSVKTNCENYHYLLKFTKINLTYFLFASASFFAKLRYFAIIIFDEKDE